MLNPNKIKMVFSSIRNKKITENYLADEAIFENRFASALMEKHLMNAILPKNKDARFWLEQLYSEECGIRDVLTSAFSLNAAGSRGAYSARWGNFLPLVQFAKRQEYLSNTLPTGEEDELYHFRSQLDSICKRLEELATDEANENRHFYANEAKYARELLKEATEEPQFMRYCNFYQLIIDNWDVLKDLSISFRFLSDLTTMSTGWGNTPESRYELTQILKTLSKDWED